MTPTTTIDLGHVARDLHLPPEKVARTIELLDEGNTVPFITRYRKDQTGGLDEEQIREWWDRWPDSNIGIATGAEIASGSACPIEIAAGLASGEFHLLGLAGRKLQGVVGLARMLMEAVNKGRCSQEVMN